MKSEIPLVKSQTISNCDVVPSVEQVVEVIGEENVAHSSPTIKMTAIRVNEIKQYAELMPCHSQMIFNNEHDKNKSEPHIVSEKGKPHCELHQQSNVCYDDPYAGHGVSQTDDRYNTSDYIVHGASQSKQNVSYNRPNSDYMVGLHGTSLVDKDVSYNSSDLNGASQTRSDTTYNKSDYYNVQETSQVESWKHNVVQHQISSTTQEAFHQVPDYQQTLSQPVVSPYTVPTQRYGMSAPVPFPTQNAGLTQCLETVPAPSGLMEPSFSMSAQSNMESLRIRPCNSRDANQMWYHNQYNSHQVELGVVYPLHQKCQTRCHFDHPSHQVGLPIHAMPSFVAASSTVVRCITPSSSSIARPRVINTGE